MAHEGGWRRLVAGAGVRTSKTNLNRQAGCPWTLRLRLNLCATDRSQRTLGGRSIVVEGDGWAGTFQWKLPRTRQTSEKHEKLTAVWGSCLSSGGRHGAENAELSHVRRSFSVTQVKEMDI